MALVAAPSLNLTYAGQGPTAGGQGIANQTSGPLAKTLYGFGIATNGSTTTAANSAPVGFIDGVQSLGQVNVLAFQSVTAPATINGTANTAVYSSVGADSHVPVGASITFAGFTNSGNNGTFTVTAVNSQSIYVVNSGSVAETNPAATGTYTVGGVPVGVDVFITGNSADTAAVLAVASTAFFPSNLTATGFTLNWAALATTAQTFHFGAVIVFNS